MNIYEKLQEIRTKLAQKNLKMTGKNEFAKYDYFELDDFLVPLNELMHEYKITAYPSFTSDMATLTVVNGEAPDELITITSPMGTANLKGCHDVQNIGAVETYQRRYLYQAMFDIAEHDGLNATQGKSEKKTVKTNKPVNTAGTPNEFIKVEARPPQPIDVFDLQGANNVDNKTLFVNALKIAKKTPEQGASLIADMFGKGVKVNDLDEADFYNLVAALGD